MPLPEAMFCSQQIHVPPELPDILKQFTKAAIRTQPHDVLQWSAAYFSSLSKGECLPVKEHVEMPLTNTKTGTGLTQGLLKVLHKQLSPMHIVSKEELEQKWKDICLPQVQLQSILELDNFGKEVEWVKFLALACSTLGGTISTALKKACEVLTRDPEGAASYIPFETFAFLYKYLAQIDGEIPETQIEEVLIALQTEANKQDGMIQPMNFLNILCPPLS
ncbi:ropporin-1-like protein [Gastrophryne carolinensis]